jgi:hypothetical protein
MFRFKSKYVVENIRRRLVRVLKLYRGFIFKIKGHINPHGPWGGRVVWNQRFYFVLY